ncbi:hypothetical protein E3E14_28030 [Streptomyces sp. ICN441]|uniref:hypothetical protein n=1 Tax=Streptomyces sp. ICN441 TaxID=2558286 RepID=UPI0010693977|nr:hypothetical protein [Streptomyces sp. ICN441]TFE38554.1 hypothetical protein E3E14_28030 [Streptomyces sp. ICN441]
MSGILTGGDLATIGSSPGGTGSAPMGVSQRHTGIVPRSRVFIEVTMTQFRCIALPCPADAQCGCPAPSVVPAPAATLSGLGAAAIVVVVFAASVSLRLLGMPLGEELALLAVAGVIAAFVVAVINGKGFSVRGLAQGIGKLAGSE